MFLRAISEQEIDSSWALIQNSDEPTEDAAPCFPRSLHYLPTQSVRRPLSQPTAPSGKSPVQGRLALFARYCRYRVRDSADSEKSPPTPLCSACEHTSSGDRPTAPAGTEASEQIFVGIQQKVSNTVSQGKEATTPTPTSDHSCRGSYSRCFSLPTVRISLADPSEGISSPSPTGSLSGESQAPCATSCWLGS